MSSASASLPNLEFHPVTRERWSDFEKLFGAHGAYGGCWCMFWRLERSEFEKQAGEGNKRAMKTLVEAGETPGLLAYARGEAVAWCSLGPRERFPVLERSRSLQRIDEEPVWSIVCFYVAPPFRRRGIMVPLLRAAVSYAKEYGVRIVEGYPIEITKSLSGFEGYTGVVSAFREVGFVEMLRREDIQPIMRYFIAAPSKSQG